MSAEVIEKSLQGLHPLARPLSEALVGAVYPLSGRELILVARENDAPSTLLTLLSGLQEARPYASLAAVQEGLDEGESAARGG